MWIFRKELSPLDKVHKLLSLFIRISLVVAAVGAVREKLWGVLFVVTLTFLLTFLPWLLEKNYRVYLPVEFELIILAFIYATLYLGDIHGYYTRFWWWDVVMHTGSGIALGFIGFMILYMLYSHEKIQGSPVLIALFTFCFGMAIGAVWEVFEFAMDMTIGTNMQKSGLIDTMWDLIVDGIGALIAAIAGFFYVKSGKAHLFDRLFERFVEENPEIFNR